MKIKLYLNENLSDEIAQRLRLNGIDAVSSHDAGMNAQDDDRQMEFAVSQARTLVTVNKKDFILIHAEYIQHQREHFGVVISDDVDTWVIYRRLLKLVATLQAEEIKNQLRWLNDFR